MNWQIRKKRTKEVNIFLEWTDKSDLRLILSDLNDLIISGIEMYSGDKKSIDREDKYHKYEFTQKYSEKIHEKVEREINGELKLVIKSNF